MFSVTNYRETRVSSALITAMTFINEYFFYFQVIIKILWRLREDQSKNLMFWDKWNFLSHNYDSISNNASYLRGCRVHKLYFHN